MEHGPEQDLLRFMQYAAVNEDIGMPEICIYVVLYQLWLNDSAENPIRISRSRVMRLSKVRSKTTYHKCISVLCEHGFIGYQPSYHPRGSFVYISAIGV